MLDSITSAVLEVLNNSCSDCGITNDLIDKQSFSCFPESPTYVTYRARLEGTSETDSGSLISLIEEWVSGGASIIVTGVLMTVDSECSVAISSLSEGECLTSDNTMIIITVAVAAIVGIVVIAIIVVIVAVVIVRHCHRSIYSHPGWNHCGCHYLCGSNADFEALSERPAHPEVQRVSL